jgi:hypothetical protein
MGKQSTRVVNIRREKADVYIGRGRGSIFGNPYRIANESDRDEIIRQFERYFLERIERDETFRQAVIKLQGKSLGCFCKPAKCHGDIIADWLDRQECNNA